MQFRLFRIRPLPLQLLRLLDNLFLQSVIVRDGESQCKWWNDGGDENGQDYGCVEVWMDEARVYREYGDDKGEFSFGGLLVMMRKASNYVSVMSS